MKIEVSRIGHDCKFELWCLYENITEEEIGKLVSVLNFTDPHYIYTYRIVAQEN